MSVEAVVRSMIQAMNRLDWEAVYTHLSDDVVVHNMPMPPLVGLDAVRAFYAAVLPITTCDWKILALDTAGSRVWTERLDDFTMAGMPVSLPVMGVFEVINGRIVQWRDYFDLKDFERQLGTSLG
jgi:limonene-1,2-epoxide hydrolase